MSFDPNKPYNDLPLLPPKADVETKAILKKVTDAARALAKLNGAAKTIPNPSLLITSITLQEAKYSSQIENIITTDDKLYQAFTAKAQPSDPSTNEVLRYREALWSGYNRLKKNELLTTNLFIKIFQKIKETDAEIRNTPGTQLVDASNGKVIYTPPEGEPLLRSLLKNLEDYIHNSSDGIDPLIKSALIHYQFESIHPFTDGNGRTGRIILILYYVLSSLLDLPILYLSRYIIETKSEYYKLLRGVTENQLWEPWILYILIGIEKTSYFTLDLLEKISTSLESTLGRVKREKQNPVPKEVIELIYEQPYCKTEFIVNHQIGARKAAERYLKELVRLKILQPVKIGKEVIYLNLALFSILSGKQHVSFEPTSD